MDSGAQEMCQHACCEALRPSASQSQEIHDSNLAVAFAVHFNTLNFTWYVSRYLGPLSSLARTYVQACCAIDGHVSKSMLYLQITGSMQLQSSV